MWTIWYAVPVEKTPEPPRSYTTIELARRLGVSLQTVQRWVDAGHLKAWKTLGGHRRIDAASAEALIASRRPPAGGRPPPRVLVVDDSPIDREILQHFARDALPTAEVTVAADGFLALLSIGQAVPDIVVTDLVMPHMDGLAMIRRLMGGDRPGPRAILVVTTLDAAEVAQRGGLPEGAQLLHKPVDPARYVELLKAAAASISA